MQEKLEEASEQILSGDDFIKRGLEVINITGKYIFFEGGKIDLHDVFLRLKDKGVSVSFDPEEDFKRISVEFNGVKFSLFANGKAMVWNFRKYSIDRVELCLEEFFEDYLRECVK